MVADMQFILGDGEVFEFPHHGNYGMRYFANNSGRTMRYSVSKQGEIMGTIYEDDEDGAVSSFEKFKAMNGGVAGHIHITKDNDAVPVYQMEDSHLINTIALFSKNVERAASIQQSKVTMLDAVMEQKAPGKKAAERLRSLISDGYPLIGRYILEANRRGIGEKANDAAKPFYETVTSLLEVDPNGVKVKALPSTSWEDSENSESGPSRNIDDAEIVKE